MKLTRSPCSLRLFQLTLNPNLFAKKPKLNPQQELPLAPVEQVAPTTQLAGGATIKEEPDAEQLLAEDAGSEGGSVSSSITAAASAAYQQETAAAAAAAAATTDAEQSLMKMQLRK